MKKEFFWENSLFYNTFPIILFYNYSRLSAIRIISLTKRVTIIVRICLCIPKKIAWKIHIHANINESFFFSFFFYFPPYFSPTYFLFSSFSLRFLIRTLAKRTQKKRSTCLRGKKHCLGPFSLPSTEYLVYAKGTVFGMETKRKYNPDGKIQVFN